MGRTKTTSVKDWYAEPLHYSTKQFVAVRMGVEPIATDRQSAMLAITPTNLVTRTEKEKQKEKEKECCTALFLFLFLFLFKALWKSVPAASHGDSLFPPSAHNAFTPVY